MNLWDGKGEFPVVGTVAEFYHDETNRSERICVDSWKNGDKLECLAIRKVGMDNLPVFFNMRDQTASCIVRMRYRPIKSDREKAIEAAMEVALSQAYFGDSLSICERFAVGLYETGLLRLPEDK